MGTDKLKIYHFIVRKVCHFLGYAILALLASTVFYSSVLYLAKFWHVCAFAVVLAVALTDEFRQSFHSNCVASLSDVALDCGGGLTMILLFWIFTANGF